VDVDEYDFLPVWEVTVRSPAGLEKRIRMTNEQVEQFRNQQNWNPFATALWIAYADEYGVTA
jgi:hypothetical protein